ncbi:MAG: DUF4230 domain-containing protein [Anaerolineae bacterium]|nr:DUF4230 domain-containing protein [Anaerolineae bacterium]
MSRGNDSNGDYRPNAIEEVEGEIIEARPRRRAPVAVDDPRVLHPQERAVPRKRRRPPPAPAPRRGCMGTCALFGGLSLLVLTLVIAFAIAVMVLGVADFIGDPLDPFLNIFGFEDDATPQVADSRTIVLGIQDLALLQTVSSDIEITKTVIDTGPAPDAELRMSYIGRVTLGIDLAQIAETDVIVNPDNSLTIMLPPVQITGCTLGSPDIVESSCTEIPFGLQDCDGIFEGLQETAYKRSMEELLETTYELELPALAYDNAEAAIAGLLNKLGFEQVTFQRSDEELPPSETCLY